MGITFQKRQKEMKRLEKRQMKEQRRAQQKAEKRAKEEAGVESNGIEFAEIEPATDNEPTPEN